MHKTTASYIEAYNKLNAAQKKAVEKIEGPVLVVAGPGTGKTQILAARIGNILDSGVAFAENILCLTYTDAGVTAMRKRLVTFIGPEAYKVNIHTFHSFCNKVIQDNLDHFGMGELEPISEIEEFELLEKLIDSFPKDSVLKRWSGNIYFDTTRLKDLFSIMKKEHISAKDIEEGVEWYLENIYPEKSGVIAGKKVTLADGTVFNKGDIRTDKIEEERESFRATIEAAKYLDTYQKMKRAAGRYDFDDMILSVLEAFETDEWILSRYQEQFQYFLVDEYQDTNGAQNAILKLLYSYWDNPNVFVVGDDDQSIYRFQGASVQNIIDFYRDTIAPLSPQEQQERVIVLKQNYRSTRAILDLSAVSINQNKERLVNQISQLKLDKTLDAAADFAKNSRVVPRINVYPNFSHEVADIANQIVKLKEQGVPLSEIGVLYAKHKYSEELFQCLNQMHVPVKTTRAVNVLEEKLTLHLLSVLRYIHDEHQIPHSREDILFDMMNYPYFKIKPIQSARLSFELRESRYTQPKTTWREALGDIQKIFDDESMLEIHRLAALTDKWQKDLQEKPVQLLFQTILDDLNIIEYIQRQDKKVWLLQELKTLFDYIKEENHRNPTMTLGDLLVGIDRMNQYGIALPFVKSAYTEEAVQLTTIHGSKGLEYKYVFLIASIESSWEKARPFTNKYKLPEGLIAKPSDEENKEDLRRLFFVALTRAKEFLYISYAEKDAKGKDLMQSKFVEEISGVEQIEKHSIKLSDEEIFKYNVLQLMQEKIRPDLIEEGMLKKRLENYSMSVTHLNNYLKCPLKFYYHNFIQIPQAKNNAMAFGSAVHDALELLFKEMRLRGEFPSVEEFVDFGQKHLYRQQDSFTKKEYEQRKSYIDKFFPAYYTYYVGQWNKENLLEFKINGVYKDININGKIDKLEFENKDVVIVDYKTGNFDTKKLPMLRGPKDPSKQKEDSSHEDLHGGDYWRQAVFYKILIHHSIDPTHKDWHLIRTEFDFVEPDRSKGLFHKLKVVIGPQDQEIVQKQIAETYQKIQQLDFTGCGKEDCVWCQGELENAKGEVQ